MAIIGFDDQIQDRQDGEEKKLSGEETFKIVKSIDDARKNLYLSPDRLAKMVATYGVVVVHDFGDEYHLTDEERESQNNYYKLFAKLNKCKRKYRKIDEYVDCARISLQCLQAVAENNTVYTSSEFIKLVFRGKIIVNGWFFPKYNGRDRKQLSWDYITEFVLGDRPSSELLKQKASDSEFLSDEELLDEAKHLFTKEEFEYILSAPSDADLYQQEFHPIDTDEEKIAHDSSIAICADVDVTKSLIKTAPELLILLKDMRREMKSSEQLNRFVSDIRMDDIEMISDYDSKRNFVSESDIPEFTGDITSSKDYHKYLQALEHYENTQIKVNYMGKMRTAEEIKELQLKEALEASGWNIRVLYDNREREKKLERAHKADKKRVKKLKKQLTKVQDRSKRRMGIDVDTEKTSKKKNKKKKKSEDD